MLEGVLEVLRGDILELVELEEIVQDVETDSEFVEDVLTRIEALGGTTLISVTVTVIELGIYSSSSITFSWPAEERRRFPWRTRAG